MTAANTGTARQGSFAGAVREARLAEAAHLDAVLALRDAKSIRLQLLFDDLSAIVSGTPGIDLALVPGEPPRLWVDLVTSVVMEPDPRTYRVTFDSQGAREVLLETQERDEVAALLTRVMAHQTISRARLSGPAWWRPPTPVTASRWWLALAFTAGIGVGALAFLALVIILK